MIYATPDTLIAETVSYLRRWCKLLAEQQWEEAFAMISLPETLERSWSVEFLRELVVDNGWFATDEHGFTDPAHLSDEGPFSLYRQQEGY